MFEVRKSKSYFLTVNFDQIALNKNRELTFLVRTFCRTAEIV